MVKKEISVLSFNILAPIWTSKKHYPSTPRRLLETTNRFEQIMKIMSLFNANIILLQETQENFNKEIKQAFSKNYHIVECFHASSHWENWLERNKVIPNGLLTLISKDFEIMDTMKIKCSSNGNYALKLTVKIENQLFDCLNCHLETVDHDITYKQINSLLTATSSIKHPVLWAGDFNLLQNQLRALEDSGFETLQNDVKTCYDNVGIRAIDHIYTRQLSLDAICVPRILSNAPLNACLNLFGSDHTPVLGQIVIDVS